RAAVTELANTVRRVFPARIDMSRISHCRQEPGESVQIYYERLFAAFNKHSGLTEPADRGDRPGIWESYLATSLLNGLRPELSQAVKHNYVEWAEGRVTTIMKYALHAEEEQRAKKERSRMKELQLAFVQGPPRFKAGEWGPRKGNKDGKRTDKKPCDVCGGDHIRRECTKCAYCKQDGHWAKACPQRSKAD
ncbi:MAG: hypothetical protein ACRDC4_03580, partial [Plesiomonas sp.]